MSVAKIVSALQFCPDFCAPRSRDPGPSLQSRGFNALLGLLPYKQQLASAEAVLAHVQKRTLQPASFEPTGLGRGVEATLTKMGGWPVYYTAPSSGHEGCNLVMFLHGGGYINEIVPAHWRFVGQMTRKAGVVCVVPIYPRPPRMSCRRRPSCCGCCWRMRDPQRSRWSAIQPARASCSRPASGCAIAAIGSRTG